MKNRTVKAMTAILTSVVLVSCSSITAAGDKTETETQTTQQIDKHDNEQLQLDNVEVYHTTTIKQFDELTEILENRKGKIIVEIVDGIVLDDDGNGQGILSGGNNENGGYYIKYDTQRFSKGDKVQSVFIYNPDNNLMDDIVYRSDSLIE